MAGRSGRGRRFAAVAWKPVRAVLLLAAFTVPVYLFVADRTPSVPARMSVSQALSQDLATVRVPVYRNAVAVLSYHDIGNGPGRYTVTPERFRAQMASLAATGFHTLTIRRLLAFLERGSPLPVRPVLVTFDGGLGSEWRQADPVLEAYGLHAVTFVSSSLLNRHGFYYLHPGELRQMIQSGRWDVEAQTDAGHNLVPVDAAGATGSFLTNLAWLPDKRRLETLKEYQQRLRQDLDMNTEELRSYGASPEVFAYPISSSSATTNNPRLLSVMRLTVAGRFPVSFDGGNKERYLDRWDAATSQQLPRFDVYSGTGPRALLRRLLAAEPLPPSTRVALLQPDDWTFEGLSRARGRAAFRAGVLQLAPPARRWQAAYYALLRSDDWQSYRLRTVISGFAGNRTRTLSTARGTSVANDTTSAAIVLGNTPEQMSSVPRYEVAVSAGHVSVSSLTRAGIRELAGAHISAQTRHQLTLVLARKRLRVTVDGRNLLNVRVSALSHGGFGFGVWRERAGSRFVRFSRLVVRPVTSR